MPLLVILPASTLSQQIIPNMPDPVMLHSTGHPGEEDGVREIGTGSFCLKGGYIHRLK